MGNNLVTAVVAVGLLAAVPAFAHHSFAAFDRTHQLQVTGTVKEWQWTNPHTWLFVTVSKVGFAPSDYSFQGYNPAELPRFGITRNKFKVGDRVVVTYFPRKDGAHGGQFVGVVFATGAPTASNAQ